MFGTSMPKWPYVSQSDGRSAADNEYVDGSPYAHDGVTTIRAEEAQRRRRPRRYPSG